MCKVKIYDKKLFCEFWRDVSIPITILAFVMALIDISQGWKNNILFIVAVVLVFIYFMLWVFANIKKRRVVKINNTRVEIKYGDIFRQPGLKVIQFNEYYDTIVDDKIISSISLNGKFINQYYSNPIDLDEIIEKDERLKSKIVDECATRLYGGKTVKYALGSICPAKDFLLLAFTHFDEDNRASLTLKEYLLCLMNMWNELDIYKSGQPISITLLGSGITRITNVDIKEQELLKFILITLKASKVDFKDTSSLTIVLSDIVKDKINLYDLWGSDF